MPIFLKSRLARPTHQTGLNSLDSIWANIFSVHLGLVQWANGLFPIANSINIQFYRVHMKYT